MKKERKEARDSITGEFVTMEYAELHPETTTVETIEYDDEGNDGKITTKDDEVHPPHPPGTGGGGGGH